MPKSTHPWYHSYVISALRRIWRWAPERKACYKAAEVKDKYRCAVCKKTFPKSEIAVDHRDPVVPISGFVDWNSYISRLFCPASNLQVLCDPCHDTKSKEERKVRKKAA